MWSLYKFLEAKVIPRVSSLMGFFCQFWNVGKNTWPTEARLSISWRDRMIWCCRDTHNTLFLPLHRKSKAGFQRAQRIERICDILGAFITFIEVHNLIYLTSRTLLISITSFHSASGINTAYGKRSCYPLRGNTSTTGLCHTSDASYFSAILFDDQ